MVSLSYKQQMTPAMVTIAILAALGLVGVVGVTIVSPIQQAEAKGCPTIPVKGDPTPPGFANSEGKCFNIPNRPR